MRSTELLADNHIATLGAESHLHCVGESVNAFFKLFASRYIEFNFFSHIVWVL